MGGLVMTEINAFAEANEIREVLHFTTNHGLIGILAEGALLSRDRLKQTDLLEDVRLLNCQVRRDAGWTGYVNLSISAVNKDFLTASRGWHPPRDGVWWTVLSFRPEILSHDGVIFATTNNVYHDVVKRGGGAEGLKALFAPRVPYGYYRSVETRKSFTPRNQPTHIQAEVLYPQRLELEYLQGIYVPKDDHIDDVRGVMASICPETTIPVEVRPEVFQ